MRNLIKISVADFSLRREMIIVQVDDGFVRNDVEDFLNLFFSKPNIKTV